nr:uncharacterized mitochondrial protein AtMg00810-like [Tanacetum cinerariifolium]
LSKGISASTPIDAEKPLLKDSDGEDVDVHTYRSMIGSLMYITSSRPDIMFVVCVCALFQVTPRVSHLNAVKRIFRYLKGKPYLGLWYPKDSPFDLVAYSDSDYASASLDRKSTTRGCQFLGCRLISWQCKKQIVVATSLTEAKYVAAASGCAQVLWIQNQLLDYGYNFMHTCKVFAVYINFNAVTFYCQFILMLSVSTVSMMSKNWLVQKKTAFGKDISNPFMADNLPKIVWFSTHHVTFNEELASPKANGSCDSPLLGVNTPRSDEDRLKLMALMVFLLQKGKSNATEGFEQIIDFLRGSYIHYAFIMNPHIYVSCIKQFWNTASVKHSDDVTRLQALVDRRKIMISEDVIREILQLDDAEGMICLPNEEIFAGLAQMGYEKPSTKLTFYKAFFSSQKFNFSKYIFDSLVCNVDSSSKFYMYPRFIQLIIQNQIGNLSTHTTRYISPTLTQKVFANMRRVGKGFSGVETPLFAEDVANEAIPSTPTPLILPSPPSRDIPSPSHVQSSPLQQPQSSPQALPQDAEFPTHFQQGLDTCSALTRHVENLEHDKAAQKLEIIKLKARVKRLERANKVKSSKLRCLKKVGTSQRIKSSDDMEDVFNQGRMIDDLDKDEGIELVVDQVKDADTAETKGRHAAEQAQKQAEIYHLDMDHPSKVLSMQEDDSDVQEVVEVVTTSKLITEVVTAATSQVSAASATISAAKPSIPVAALTVVAAYTRKRKGDKGKGILIETSKPMKKKDQIELDAEYARKLHEEINKDHEEINKDIDWDAAIDHTVSEVRKNMIAYLKNTDGYKMDFFKGMSYDEIRLIFQARFDANMRFLLKSRVEMEEEDREILKSINETSAQKAAKRRKLNKEAQEVEDLKKHLEVVNDEDDDVFTEATPLARKFILLVEKRYPLSKFTPEQLVNVTRLQVEEESEMSLELLSTMASVIIYLADNQKFNFSKPHKKHKPRRKQRKEAEVPYDESEDEDHVPTPFSDPLPSGRRVKSPLEKDSLGGQENVSKQERMIEEIDQDDDIALDADIQGRKNNNDILGVDDLSGEEVVLDTTTSEHEEHIIEDVSTAEPVNTDGEVVTTVADKVTVVPTTYVTEDEITMAQALVALKNTKPKVMVQEEEQSHIPTVSSSKDKGKAKMIEPEVPIKNKDQMRMDKEYARQLEAEEQEAARLSIAQQDEEANIS